MTIKLIEVEEILTKCLMMELNKLNGYVVYIFPSGRLPGTIYVAKKDNLERSFKLDIELDAEEIYMQRKIPSGWDIEAIIPFGNKAESKGLVSSESFKGIHQY